VNGVGDGLMVGVMGLVVCRDASLTPHSQRPPNMAVHTATIGAYLGQDFNVFDDTELSN